MSISESDKDLMLIELCVVLSVHPKEWRDHWSILVPAGRNADPAELKGVRSNVMTSMAVLLNISPAGLCFPRERCIIIHDR